MTDRGVWEWHEMWYLADNSGLFVLFPASFSFLFHFMFPFLHATVPELKLRGHGLLWRGLWEVIRERRLVGRSESTVVSLHLEWKTVRHLQIIKKEWIPLLQRVRQHSSPWYLNYLFLVVKPDVACLCLFSELEPKHVCVPGKKGMGQLGCSFIAELGTLKPLWGVFVGHVSSPHTALDFFVVIVRLPCFSSEHWQSKEPLKIQVRKKLKQYWVSFPQRFKPKHASYPHCWDFTETPSATLWTEWPFICPSRKES